MIKIEKINKSFGRRFSKDRNHIIKDVSFTIGKGETLGLMGPSGCGKTTLARIILGLIKPDSGSIIYKNEDLAGLDKKQFKEYRREIQLISQKPQSFFNPSIRLGKSIVEPLKNFGLDYREYEGEILDLLEDLKLDEKLLDRYPHQVSGGEIQRLSLLRALLLDPKVLILDEPTSMLDISVQAQIIDLLKKLKEDRDISYLFISHDEEVVEIFSDRIIRMENGEIVK